MSDFKKRLAKRLEDAEFAKAWEEAGKVEKLNMEILRCFKFKTNTSEDIHTARVEHVNGIDIVITTPDVEANVDCGIYCGDEVKRFISNRKWIVVD